MDDNRNCPQCQQPLPHDAPAGLCPQCLLKVAMGSQPEPGRTIVVGSPNLHGNPLPRAGEQFGPYRIVRELGRGGMGAVYEAEDLESGRRVALKVLSHQLHSSEARARFLREGRLAASINHPNSVYVFGTDEIDGTPVIAMEFVAGGTLQERVERNGPLSPAEAVDVILQVIAGLEAAQAIGILHRDIKPANCFEDADGTVKVGDFGLSISTAARTETNLTIHGAFLGTPAFCSPEQLRGDELSVRSDVYAVGVTLFYLLTGRLPFEGKNAVQLLANAIEKPAPSPRKLRKEVPQGVANVVLRCLAKQPGDRFHGYDELRQALSPFSSDAPVPAPLALRAVAGVLDAILMSAIGMTIAMVFLGGTTAFFEAGGFQSTKSLKLMAVSFGFVMLYYAITEGFWGASAGKAICGLRVIGRDRNVPGIPRAALRACLFVMAQLLPYWIFFGGDPRGILRVENDVLRFAMSFGQYIILALMFSTARRRNGLAAVHDLVSRTMVIRRAARQARPSLESPEVEAVKSEMAAKVGPYHVLEPIGSTADGEWMLGYDTRLLRKVWIRVVPPGTPPVQPALRNLGRIGRLRWLSGRRAGGENWDAFEGISGKPLLSLLDHPQPWGSVRFWLMDLARELAAAERDATLPAVLGVDRVWITAEGRAKLLDFPAPGAGENVPSLSSPPVTPIQFLSTVARATVLDPVSAANANGGLREPLPLHARSFLDGLSSMRVLDDIVIGLKAITQRMATVSRARRATLVAGCVSVPVVAAAAAIFGLRFVETWQQTQPQVAQLAQLLGVRSAQSWMPAQKRMPDQLLGIYIATHFKDTITDSNQWNTLYALSMIQGEKRVFAERAAVEYANAGEEDIRKATAAIKPLLPSMEIARITREPWFPFMIAGATLAMYVAIPAIIAAFLFRGGLVLLAAGVAVVRKDGLRASRARVFWRSLVAWAPVFGVFVVAIAMTKSVGSLTAALCATVLIAIPAVVSLLLPKRGLQDRLAGTTLVPR